VLARRLDESYSVEVRSAITPLTVAKVTANSAYRFVSPFIATVASGLDISLATIGTAIAISEIVGLSAPLIIRFTGRYRRRSVICSGLLGMGAGASIAATSTGPAQFTVGITLLALAKIVFDLGTIAWFTDRVDYIRVGRVIGLIESAWAIGLFTGVVLMGLLTGLTSWRWGYVLAIIAMAVMAAVLRRRLPDEPERPATVAGVSGFYFHLGPAWWVIAATLGLTAAAQTMFVTFGKWLQDDFHFSDTKLAVVIFGLGGFELLASLGSAGFADRWGKQRSTMYAAGAMIPTVGGLAFLHSHLAFGLALLALFIVAFEFAIVSTVSLSNGLVPSNPSAGLGMMVGGATLGRAVMAPIATSAFTSHGMWLPAALGAGCAVLTLACHLRYRAARAM